MKNNPLYKQLKQKALDGNYTIEQVQAVGFNKAAELLGTREFTITFLNNMKRGVIDALRNRDDKMLTEQLKEDFKAHLDANNPDWEVERGREGDKPFVTIWLEGKS